MIYAHAIVLHENNDQFINVHTLITGYKPRCINALRLSAQKYFYADAAITHEDLNIFTCALFTGNYNIRNRNLN